MVGDVDDGVITQICVIANVVVALLRLRIAPRRTALVSGLSISRGEEERKWALTLHIAAMIFSCISSECQLSDSHALALLHFIAIGAHILDGQVLR